MWISVALLVCSMVLSTVTKQGVFHNLGWIAIGLLFILHPVCPESWKWRYGDDTKRMERDFRIAGGVCILWGLMTRYGV